MYVYNIQIANIKSGMKHFKRHSTTKMVHNREVSTEAQSVNAKLVVKKPGERGFVSFLAYRERNLRSGTTW